MYVATGDAASYGSVDTRALRTQNLDSLAGKMLRVNTANGQGFADNPFYNGSLTANRSKVLAYGFRNDFRFNFKPGAAQTTILSGDVGWNDWEETTRSRQAATTAGRATRATYSSAATWATRMCQSLYSAGNGEVRVPRIQRTHRTLRSVGGVFTGVNGYPPQFHNTYFFGDYARDEISVLKLDAREQHGSRQLQRVPVAQMVPCSSSWA